MKGRDHWNGQVGWTLWDMIRCGEKDNGKRFQIWKCKQITYAWKINLASEGTEVKAWRVNMPPLLMFLMFSYHPLHWMPVQHLEMGQNYFVLHSFHLPFIIILTHHSVLNNLPSRNNIVTWSMTPTLLNKVLSTVMVIQHYSKLQQKVLRYCGINGKRNYKPVGNLFPQSYVHINHTQNHPAGTNEKTAQSWFHTLKFWDQHKLFDRLLIFNGDRFVMHDKIFKY